MRRAFWIVTAVAAVAAAAVAVGLWRRAEPRIFTPTRLDVALNVLEDGHVEVEERSEITFEAPSTTFRRRAPVWRHDGVSVLSGSVDGREFPLGSGPGQLEVGAGPALDATWHLPSPATGPHVFVLKYRAANAVEVSGIRGTIAWRVVDSQHDYDGALTCVALAIPGTAIILDNPGFEESWAQPGESGCAVASSHDSLTRRVTFTIDTMKPEEPAWQYYRRRSRDLMPAFVSSGIFILIVGAGIILMLRLKYPPFRVRPDRQATAALAPAVEAALARGRYGRQVVPDLAAAGLVDPERLQVVKDLRRAAVVTGAFGAITWIVAATVFDYLAPWPLAIPIGIIGSAVWFWFAAGRLPILSQNGEEARARVLYSARVRDHGRTSA